MQKIIIGIFIGIALTIGSHYGYTYYKSQSYKADSAALDLAKNIVENMIENSKVLDLSISPNSQTKVNYEYEKLYDAHVTYNKSGKIKKITFTFGYYNNIWITPLQSEVAILDDQAKIVHVKTSE